MDSDEKVINVNLKEEDFLNNSTEKKNLKTKKTKMIILIIVPVFLVILAIILCVLLIKKKDKYKILKKTSDFEIQEIDRRDYRLIELNNGLKALIIYDKNSQSSGISLTSSGGGIQDLIPGMGHFCEHILFDGSKKHPEEGGFWTFIKNLGGTNNAYTGYNLTTFHYDIPNKHLDITLEYFASFIDEPLFNKNNSENEITIIDNEYTAARTNINFIVNKLIVKILNPKNPVSKNWFGTGNRESLTSKPLEDLIEDTKSFFKIFYKPSSLNLVVYTGNDMGKVTKMISKYFNFKEKKITDKDKEKFEEIFKGYEEKLITPEQRGNFFLIDSSVSSTLNAFIIYLVFPPQVNNLDNKFTNFIFYLLNSMDEGTLCYYLAVTYGINFSVGSSDYDAYSIFVVNIIGAENIYQNAHNIIKIFYWYFRKLGMEKNIDQLKTLYKNYKKIADSEFKFKPSSANEQKSSNSREFSEKMRNLKNVEDVTKRQKYYDELNIDEFQNFVKGFNTSNSVFGFISTASYETLKEYEIFKNPQSIDYKEVEYMNLYDYEGKLNNDFLDELDLFNETEFPDIKYRNLNNLVTNITDYSKPCYEIGKECEDDEFQTKLGNLKVTKILPEKLKNEDPDYQPLKFLYQIDKENWLPKTYINMYLEGFLDYTKSDEEFLYGQIFYLKMVSGLNSLSAPLQESLNVLTCTMSSLNISIAIESFKDISANLVGLVKTLIYLNISESEFNLFKTSLFIQMQVPQDISAETSSIINRIISKLSLPEDYLKIMDNVTYTGYQEYMEECLNKYNLYIFMRGDIDKNEIQSKYVPIFSEDFKEHTPFTQEFIYRILKNPRIVEHYKKHAYSNASYTMGGYEFSFDGYDKEVYLYLPSLFNSYIGYTYFNEIRTKKGLAYEVLSSAQIIPDKEIAFFWLMSRSNVIYPDEMVDEFDQVTKGILNKSINISTPYEVVRDSFINNNLQIPSTPSVKNTFIASIQTFGGLDGFKKRINNLKKVSLDDMLNFMKTNFVDKPKKIDMLYYNVSVGDLEERIGKLKGKKYILNDTYEMEYTNDYDYIEDK